MDDRRIPGLFQGIAPLVVAAPLNFWGRIGLILFGFVLVHLGKKGVLEALPMIPVGLGMAVVNARAMLLEHDRVGTLFVEALVTGTGAAMDMLQLNWLQPICTFMNRCASGRARRQSAGHR